jgi:hypothetical protein
VPILVKPPDRTQTGQLDFEVAQDAMQREKRAKAALRAILKNNGCSEAQIDDVLSSVDNREDGDLRP